MAELTAVRLVSADADTEWWFASFAFCCMLIFSTGALVGATVGTVFLLQLLPSTLLLRWLVALGMIAAWTFCCVNPCYAYYVWRGMADGHGQTSAQSMRRKLQHRMERVRQT